MPNFEEVELRLKVNVADHSFSYCILLKSGGKLFLCFRDNIIGASSMPFFKVKVHLNSADATWSERATLVYNINYSRPQSLLGAWARRPRVQAPGRLWRREWTLTLKKSNYCHYFGNMPYWPSVRSGWLDGGEVFFFCAFLTEAKWKSMKRQNRMRLISCNLGRTSLVNKGFVIRPKRELFLVGATKKIPREGPILPFWESQSEHTTLLILPSCRFSHKIIRRIDCSSIPVNFCTNPTNGLTT